jgi:hypothetical protein
VRAPGDDVSTGGADVWEVVNGRGSLIVVPVLDGNGAATIAYIEEPGGLWSRLMCAGKHTTLHNFCIIFWTSRLLRTLRFPYTEVPSFLGSRPVSDVLRSPLKYLWA